MNIRKHPGEVDVPFNVSSAEDTKKRCRLRKYGAYGVLMRLKKHVKVYGWFVLTLALATTFANGSHDLMSNVGMSDSGNRSMEGNVAGDPPTDSTSDARGKTSSLLQQLLSRSRTTKAAGPLIPILQDEHIRRIQEGLKTLSNSVSSKTSMSAVPVNSPSSQRHPSSLISTMPDLEGTAAASPASSKPMDSSIESRFGTFHLPNLASSSSSILFPFRNPLFQQLDSDNAQQMASIRPMSAPLPIPGPRPPAAALAMPPLLQQQALLNMNSGMSASTGNSLSMSNGMQPTDMGDNTEAAVVNVVPDGSAGPAFNDPEVAVELITTTRLDNGTVAVYSCGGLGKERVTNFVNPNFPYFDASSGECTFTLTITSPHVCQVRVDFVQTELLSPSEGLCLDQFLEYSGDIWEPGVSRICGNNPDQHFYLELHESQTIRMIRFKVTTIKREAMYRFGLWITQINCNENVLLQAPPGCFQYFTDTSGTIKSFNFDGSHVTFDQHYRVCVKGRRHGCQLVLDANDGNFGLKKEGGSPYDSGVGDVACSHSYLMVPGSSADGGAMRPTVDRFCGGKLSFSHGDIRSRPIVARFGPRIGFLEVHTGPRLPPYPPQVHLVGFNISYNIRTACG